MQSEGQDGAKMGEEPSSKPLFWTSQPIKDQPISIPRFRSASSSDLAGVVKESKRRAFEFCGVWLNESWNVNSQVTTMLAEFLSKKEFRRSFEDRYFSLANSLAKKKNPGENQTKNLDFYELLPKDSKVETHIEQFNSYFLIFRKSFLKNVCEESTNITSSMLSEYLLNRLTFEKFQNLCKSDYSKISKNALLVLKAELDARENLKVYCQICQKQVSSFLLYIHSKECYLVNSFQEKIRAINNKIIRLLDKIQAICTKPREKADAILKISTSFVSNSAKKLSNVCIRKPDVKIYGPSSFHQVVNTRVSESFLTQSLKEQPHENLLSSVNLKEFSPIKENSNQEKIEEEDMRSLSNLSEIDIQKNSPMSHFFMCQKNAYEPNDGLFEDSFGQVTTKPANVPSNFCMQKVLSRLRFKSSSEMTIHQEESSSLIPEPDEDEGPEEDPKSDEQIPWLNVKDQNQRSYEECSSFGTPNVKKVNDSGEHSDIEVEAMTIAVQNSISELEKKDSRHDWSDERSNSLISEAACQENLQLQLKTPLEAEDPGRKSGRSQLSRSRCRSVEVNGEFALISGIAGEVLEQLSQSKSQSRYNSHFANEDLDLMSGLESSKAFFEDSKDMSLKQNDPMTNNLRRISVFSVMKKRAMTEYGKLTITPSFVSEQTFMEVVTKLTSQYHTSLLGNPFSSHFFQDREFLDKVGELLECKEMNAALFTFLAKLHELINRRIAAIIKSKREIQQGGCGKFAQPNAADIKKISQSTYDLGSLEPYLAQGSRFSRVAQSPIIGQEPDEKAGRNSIDQPFGRPSQPRSIRIKKAVSESAIVDFAVKEHFYQQKTQSMSLRNFVITKTIGKGAYGVVQRGVLATSKEVFALKLINLSQNLSSKAAADLQKEVTILRKIKGRFLVDAYFSFVDAGKLVIVMEYLSGGDFRTLLEEHGHFDEEVARFYLAELLLGLEDLHRTIIHRDLKPENLLLGEDGHLKISDFGLSELRRKISGPQEPGTIEARGTIAYMAPELLIYERSRASSIVIPQPSALTLTSVDSESPVGSAQSGDLVGDHFFDEASQRSNTLDFQDTRYNLKSLDWWAFGCLVYEFLVGMSPFADSTEANVVANIKKGAIEWPMEDEQHLLSKEARNLIIGLLDPNPSTRLGSKGVRELKSHPFFRGVNWEKIGDCFSPIHPEPRETQQSEDYPNPSAKERPIYESFNSKFSKLTMSRADLLHQRNQRRVLQIQNSIRGSIKSPRLG